MFSSNLTSYFCIKQLLSTCNATRQGITKISSDNVVSKIEIVNKW